MWILLSPIAPTKESKCTASQLLHSNSNVSKGTILSYFFLLSWDFSFTLRHLNAELSYTLIIIAEIQPGASNEGETSFSTSLFSLLYEIIPGLHTTW